MKITQTARFRASFDALSQSVKKKTQKRFQLLFKNIFYPSLHTEKLEPRDKNIWSFRIDKNYRVIFTFITTDNILLLDIGPHDIYKKY